MLEEIIERYGLGPVVGEPEELHGGANRIIRLATTSGMFAVHELLALAPDALGLARCEEIYGLERTAAAAGVVLAAPVPMLDGFAACVPVGAVGPVVVHEWVDAPMLGDRVPTAGFHASLGRSLGRLHGARVPATSVGEDMLERRTTASEWRALGAAAHSRFDWADKLVAAADELAASYDLLDGWEAGTERVASHRDLTAANVLDRGGEAVLIDWESAGTIGLGSEVGRTALDHGLVEEGREGELATFLRSYATETDLPPLGEDWCALWIRGLVVFADHCARSCLEGTAPASLLAFQSDVVRSSPAELQRRLALVPELVDRLGRALP